MDLKLKNTVERLSVEIEAKDKAFAELQRSTEALIANNAQVEKELAEVKKSM
jgi:chaperonin cofactor prefoldin